MKRKLLSYWVSIALLSAGLTGIFMGLPVAILDEYQLSLLKQDKSFWEWTTSHGPQAIHYIEKGSGDNHVIFIHGFRSHTFTWRKLIPALSESGYHVWALDLIGFGLSDKPDAPIYTQEHFVDQIIAFMDAKQIDSAHLVGSSMGGGISLKTALKNPSKVKSLTLISALGYNLNFPIYLYFMKNMDFLWGPFLSPPMIRNCLGNLIYDRTSVTEEQVEAYTLPYRLPGGTSASLKTMRQFDFNKLSKQHKHYHKITQPVLVIWGEKDSLIPKSHYELFLRDFPNADRLLLTNCGHIPQEENPDDVLAAMLPFLKGSQ